MSLNSSRRKLPEMVSEALVQFIAEKALNPGDKLPTEKELSQRLGIGRTSLREGIRQLETVGLLSSHQGKGIYLEEITLDSLFTSKKHIPMASFLTLGKHDILDLLAVRLMIESEACRLAARRITDEELATLKNIHHAMSNAFLDHEEFIAHAVEFHKQLVLCSGNVILPRLFEFIEDLYDKQVSIIANSVQAMEHSLSFHEKILMALTEKNAARVEEYLKEHLEDVEKIVVTHFDAREAGHKG